MNHQKAIGKQRVRRRFRVRKRIQGTPDRPRLSVHRTLKHIYAQVIDDTQGKTVVAASTRDKDLASQIPNGGNKDSATAIGRAIAQRAQAAGVKQVRFDRGAFKYHGRIAALADAAREGGLEF